MGGHRPKMISGEHRVWVLERVKAADFTLRGLVAELAERGLKVDCRSVWEFVHAEKLSFKKTSWLANAIVPTSQGDEPSGSNIKAVSSLSVWCSPTRPGPGPIWRHCGDGRRAAEDFAARSTRPLEDHDVPGGFRHDHIEAPWFLEGPIDGDSFRLYVEKVLLPTLHPGDIVVMDNLGNHRGKIVRQLIRSAGAKLFFLNTPPT
jgi:hypothetical protein